jgi:hypothetical protein
MVSVAKARPPIVGRRLRADCKRGIDFKEGVKYQKTKQAKPIMRIKCLFSQVKPKDLDLIVA